METRDIMARRQIMPKLRPLLLSALVVAGAKLFFFLAYIGANAMLGPPPDGGLRSICQWDCEWYRSIAESGYHTSPYVLNGRLVANYAFWPVMPAVTARLMRATGLDFVQAGVALNAFCSLVFGWIALSYHRELGLADERAAIVFLAGFLISPWSIYNHIPYSEMLFNLTLLGTFVFWQRGNYAAAATFGFGLTATRVTGIILPVLLFAEMVIRKRSRVLRLLLEPDGRIRAMAIMPLGFVAFCVYLYLHIGDPLAFARIQEFGWLHAFRNPFTILIAGLGGPPRNQYAAVAYTIATLVLLIGVSLRRIPIALAAMAWLTPSLALIGKLNSMARYEMGIFPIYLILPALPRRSHFFLILLLGTAQAVFIYYWIQSAAFLV